STETRAALDRTAPSARRQSTRALCGEPRAQRKPVARLAPGGRSDVFVGGRPLSPRGRAQASCSSDPEEQVQVVVRSAPVTTDRSTVDPAKGRQHETPCIEVHDGVDL